MSEMKQRAEPGWKVVDPDGKFVGTVERVREDHLIVAQGRVIQHTLYIPFDHLRGAADGQVTVSVPAGQVEAEGWRFPPNAGFTHGEGDFWDSPVTSTAQARGSGATDMGSLHGSLTDGRVDPEQMEDQSSKEDDED
jgi:hypothetical protein